MSPDPKDPIRPSRDPRRRLLDDALRRDVLSPFGDRGGFGPRHPKVDEGGAVAPGEGVAGPMPPWKTTLDDPPPGYVPGGTAAPLRDRWGGILKKHDHDRLWFPHLLIRTAANDRGQRPVWQPVPSWLSPDIHLFPATLVPPGGPVDLSHTVASPQVGETYTVGVHIWNLGRFPAHGIRVKVWWVEPGFFSGVPDPRYTPHFIGGAWSELGDRDSGRAHRIVLMPNTWTITDTGMLHQCLLATVECATDPWTGVLDANHDRHVGQRNLSLIAAAGDAAPLLAQLTGRFDKGDRLTIGVGPARAVSFRGAVAQHVASSAKEAGGWPVRAGKSRTVATVTRDDRGLTVRVGRAKPVAVENLGGALQAALGAKGLTGQALLASPVLADLGPALVHLSTPANGYTLLVQP